MPRTGEDVELLTIAEVARRVRVHPETVRRWIRSGRLRGVLPGGDRAGYRIARADLERFLDRGALRHEGP
jgi:excisionase family DNA binding protein